MLRRTVLAVTLSATVLALAACNTVKGFGRDVQSVGEAGEEAIH